MPDVFIPGSEDREAIQRAIQLQEVTGLEFENSEVSTRDGAAGNLVHLIAVDLIPFEFKLCEDVDGGDAGFWTGPMVVAGQTKVMRACRAP